MIITIILIILLLMATYGATIGFAQMFYTMEFLSKLNGKKKTRDFFVLIPMHRIIWGWNVSNLDGIRMLYFNQYPKNKEYTKELKLYRINTAVGMIGAVGFLLFAVFSL